jgi:predicted transcriptional regulator
METVMKTLPLLPDAEYDVMQIIWGQPVPITSAQVAALAEPLRNWKLSTTLTLLRRLADRGFLHNEKRGKELHYTPLVTREAYIKAETNRFMEKFHKKSLHGLMCAMFTDKKPNAEEIAELKKWLTEDGGGQNE